MESLERASQHFQIVGIGDAGHVPAVADEARGNIVAVGPTRRAVKGDVIVVVDPAEGGKSEVSGQRSGLATDAFHQIAVGTDRVNVEVEDFETGTIEICRLPSAGHRHADAVADALAKRSGGGFDSRSQVRL